MKIGFSTLSCPQWSVEQVIDAAVQMDYAGIEWRLLNGNVIDPMADAEQVRAAVALARTRGIATCCLDTSCHFNLADTPARDQQVLDLQRWIALAHRLDVPLLRVFGGANQQSAGPGLSDETVNGWVADALQAAAPTAEAAGVTVALETHDAFSSARRTATVLNQVASPRVGAVWDSHHPYRVGESPAQVIAALGTHLVHVHIKDARHPAPGSADWQLVLMGEGEVPVREQLEALQRQGYAGWVVVEWEKKWHPEIEEPEVALPQHRQWLSRTLKD
ncbi:MAG: sugar phosphate isomerase/epimerase family protein [Chloroflexota bacterium]